MKRLAQLFPLAMLACMDAFAQSPLTTLTLRPVVTPGTTIGGHTFTSATVIGNAVMSDAEITFIANWAEGDRVRSGVFTTHRLVAADGDIVDGHVIREIDPGAHLAINHAAQVAFSAVLQDNDNATAIVIEKHLAFAANVAGYSNDGEFTLTDEGHVVMGVSPAQARTNCVTAAPQPKKPSLWDRLHVQPPTLPNIPGYPNRSPITLDPAPAAAPGPVSNAPGCLEYPFTLLPANHRGEIVFPINTGVGGFLFVASPAAR
jgi:hypothetical protein